MRMRTLVSTLAAMGIGMLAALAVLPPASAGDVARTASPEDAKRRAAELDARFIDLKAAKSDDEADPIVADIWRLWMQSGDEEIDQILHRASSLMGIGAHQLALPLLDEVISRAPDYAEGWNKRATLLFIAGEYARSLTDCEEVLKREPRHFGALAGMGLIGIAQGNDKAALQAFRRALQINPFLKERNLVKELEEKVEGRPL